MLTPGGQNEFIVCQKANVCIASLPIMDMKIWWNSTLELLECDYWLRQFTCEWLQSPKYRDYKPHFTTEDEWRIAKYVMEVLRLFRYWTLWMSKRHTVTLHQLIPVYNDVLNRTNGLMWPFAIMETQWENDLFFAVKLAWQALSKYDDEVTPKTGMVLSSAHILDPYWKLQSFRKWDNGMHINPEDETSYIPQCREAFPKYKENW